MFDRFPFDWPNPMGFLAAFILIYIFQLNVMVLITYGICLEIGMYMLITSLTKDIKNDLFVLNEMIKLDPNPMELFKQLYDFIQFHSTVKRFLKNMHEIIGHVGWLTIRTAPNIKHIIKCLRQSLRK